MNAPVPKDLAVHVPDGWSLESMPRLLNHVILSTPPPGHYMATIDFHARGFRAGCSISGRFVGEEWNKPRKKYRGRGWKQELINDAVTYLRADLQ